MESKRVYKRPRLSVSLEPDLLAALKEYSELSGRSLSAVVNDLLRPIQPVLTECSDLYRLMRDKEEVLFSGGEASEMLVKAAEAAFGEHEHKTMNRAERRASKRKGGR